MTFQCTVKGEGAASIFGRAVSDRQDDTLSCGQSPQPDHLGLWAMAFSPACVNCAMWRESSEAVQAFMKWSDTDQISL